MCGTIQNLSIGPELGGQLTFADVRIKRQGRHSLRTLVTNSSTDTSAPEDFAMQEALQRQVLGRLLMTDAAIANELDLLVVPDKGFYLASDYGPIQQLLRDNITRAGTEIFPHPACIVMDRYGNRVTNIKRRIGLLIRDSDRDDYSVQQAVARFVSDPMKPRSGGGVQGWPQGTGFPLPEYVPQDFDFHPDHDQHTAQDDGCPPVGEPDGGCPKTDMHMDRVVSPRWCPSTQEERYCYGCLTAERYFQSFNKTFWKQAYEFVNTSILVGSQQNRGAPDCPDSHKHCFDDGTNCGCLIKLVSMRKGDQYDLCEACTSRSMPMGLPVVEAVDGRAEFPGVTCRTPRKGYRFLCVSPMGMQDSALEAPDGQTSEWVHDQLYEVAWELRNARTPPEYFAQEKSWGSHRATSPLSWMDKSGFQHPEKAECERLCKNDTAAVTSVVLQPGQGPEALVGSAVTIRRYHTKDTCKNACWKYSFPVALNALWPYVLTESPALSLPFTVSAGDVDHLLVRPLPGILVVAQDITIPGVSTPAHAGQVSFLAANCVTLRLAAVDQAGTYAACLPDTRFFEMADRYGNNNRTSLGEAYVSLDPGDDSIGSEVSGVTRVPLSHGRASFNHLRISAAGTGMRLKFSYRRYYDRGVALMNDTSVIVGLSPTFTVLPAPPRVAGVFFGEGHTSLRIVFDTDTNQGQDLLASTCRILASLDLFSASSLLWTNVPSPR
ncbi:MAG: hypothetical protein ACPIOQ_12895, partial [Promethearchaeia archaeon]